KYQDWKLENNSEAKNYREEKIGVFIHRDHRLELAAVTDQKIQSGGVDELVSEYTSRREQEHGCTHKGHNVTFFIAVEAGRDEHPDLVHDKRSRHDNASHGGGVTING